ncbi:hypothetical protein OE699_09330 [Sedimentimonas flavescens]|uniref:Uncharacterized protein n=1 Tax=Sedimentimonas flavescens TaxID=2851012 RepID=A0ABT2ZZ80_9RHOB|nr:hypothetical protein [Sedimentimonas flavescens]MCV2879056.1 hypothetical protein [Sedimentimonas flavescens]
MQDRITDPFDSFIVAPSQDPFYEWGLFSSRTSENGWSFYKKRPYEILLLPGYTIPEALNRRSRDAVYYDGEVSEPVVVLDGYSLDAMFEAVRICLDPLGQSEFIKVRNVETGDYEKDPRPQIYLRHVKPKLIPDYDKPYWPEHHKYYLDLRNWIQYNMLRNEKLDGKLSSKEISSLRQTVNIYNMGHSDAEMRNEERFQVDSDRRLVLDKKWWSEIYPGIDKRIIYARDVLMKAKHDEERRQRHARILAERAAEAERAQKGFFRRLLGF